MTNTPALTMKDFTSDQEVRWCPGCGDYAILKAMQRTLPELGVTRENTVFVSGIGCSSRFPYYMNTYGFHTIHGRAPAIATGVKLANPELDVWMITGDGDGLSIGGNHLMHVLRRNVDLNILLFNNEIYGLTKGQYSPTSAAGTRSPSTPYGSIDTPMLPSAFALGVNARFVARCVDTDLKSMPTIFRRAKEHKGASFVEIFQNCIVYNDGVFEDFSTKAVAAERQLHVKHGEKMIFGKELDKGIVLDRQHLCLKVVQLADVDDADVLVHDETNKILANMLVNLAGENAPMVLGVLYCDPAELSYEEAVHQQIKDVKAKKGTRSINDLMNEAGTWTVE